MADSLSGKTGNISTASTQGGTLAVIADMENWNIDSSANTEDKIVFGSGMWTDKDVINYGWTGSADGYFVAANSVVIGSVIWGKFLIDASTNYRYGNCVVTKVGIATAANGMIKQSFEFGGKGELFNNAIS